ncbi:hypothetical protein [Acinetobacter nosocomialis]|uniref:hypothetical protein n=1 Tax=Acinetobacter nosocomialis TaxID=106654 RepID=UPI001F21F9B7|nr:hypothetical protein [Acinetobacter nosocomialis]MCE5995623.1 hypothetical protein [Acinetobacter nosocomialis]MCH2007760.1 hypothetical protein [Acinetobacter nosocomialis]HBM1867680.1 hypothetical protein [Acinetobacter nosocomialis]HCT3319658.1 hypothetical protein [Acinetobacter nosocomialis]
MNSKVESIDLEVIRADLLKKVNLLRKRKYAFSPINELAEKSGISSSIGYDSLLKKIRQLTKGEVETILSNFQKALTPEVIKHCLYDNKAVSIYKLPKQIDLNALEKSLNTLTSNNSIDNKYYSLEDIVEKDFIARLQPDADMSIFVYHDQRSYVFRSREESTKVIDSFNEKLDPLDENQEILELIKVIKVTIPTFDFVVLDKKLNILVIGFDLAYVFPKAMIIKSLDQLENKIKKIKALSQIKKLNFRNAIENMETESDGVVFGHSFCSSGGTFNHLGKTSSKRADVRKDSFFTKGSTGEILDYYGIRKRYNTGKRDCAVTVALSYREYKASALTPVYVAVLDYMQEANDLRHCCKKLLDNS